MIKSPLFRRDAFLSICAIGFFARLSYSMARTPVLALFAHYLGAPPEGIGLAVGISTVTGIFFKLPSGVLSDLFGRRSMLILSLFVFSVVPFFYWFVTGYWELVAVRFLHGFATAVYGPVSMALVADLAGTRKAERLSWFSSITIIGSLCGAPFGGFLLWWLSGMEAPTLFTFHLIYTAVGVLGTIALLTGLGLNLRLQSENEERREYRTLGEVSGRFVLGLKEVLGDFRVVITSSMEGLQNMTLGALEAFLPVYAVVQVGLNSFQAGLLWGVQIIATLAAKPVMGRIADIHGRKPMVAFGMICCAVAFGAVPLTSSFTGLAWLALLFGLGEALVTSSAAAMVADMCQKKHYGAAMGTFGSIFDVGHASGPIVAGILISFFSEDYFQAFLPLSALLFLGCFLFWVTVPENRVQTLPDC